MGRPDVRIMPRFLCWTTLSMYLRYLTDCKTFSFLLAFSALVLLSTSPLSCRLTFSFWLFFEHLVKLSPHSIFRRAKNYSMFPFLSVNKVEHEYFPFKTEEFYRLRTPYRLQAGLVPSQTQQTQKLREILRCWQGLWQRSEVIPFFALFQIYVDSTLLDWYCTTQAKSCYIGSHRVELWWLARGFKEAR